MERFEGPLFEGDGRSRGQSPGMAIRLERANALMFKGSSPHCGDVFFHGWPCRCVETSFRGTRVFESKTWLYQMGRREEANEACREVSHARAQIKQEDQASHSESWQTNSVGSRRLNHSTAFDN